MSESILLSGGAGYIGSHACVALAEAGYDVVVLDNFSNSLNGVLAPLQRLLGGKLTFVHGDVRDRPMLDRLLVEQRVFAVMHFAGLKAVGESTEEPLRYYDNNVQGTLTLLSAMVKAGVRKLVFSSSATVYGDPVEVPIREDAPLLPRNPYGRSKLMVEQILGDLIFARPDWSVACLRYFNPIGAHPSGLIGESPRDTPNNLMPFLSQVATGRRKALQVFGGDWPTRDGTGVRDYIHVMDLVDGHVRALEFCAGKSGALVVNLGTGRGSTVLEVIQAFEHASHRAVPYEIVGRRAGDVAECWADASLANTMLGWMAQRDLRDACEDSWRWQNMNPQGYSR